jgi:hypothetical protein
MPWDETVKDGSESEMIALLKQRLSKLETETGRLQGLSYQPRPTDVVITTTPKAGTTWMQQICHQLRSNGDMTFDEISSVVPWIELAYDQGQDLGAPQWNAIAEAKLRRTAALFKTHAWQYRHRFQRPLWCCGIPTTSWRAFIGFGMVLNPVPFPDSFANEFWLARGLPTSKMQNASYFHHLRRGTTKE